VLRFPFKITSRAEGRHLTGFTVKMRDGKVLSWSPIIGESPDTIQPGTSQGSFGEQSFELFLVTDSLTNVLNNFEAEGQVDTSTLKITPDIAFKAKAFAGNSGNQASGEITVILVMSDQDVAKLKNLTENNFGKRTLLVCRNKVVAAPAIMEPITSKQFMFTVKDPRVLDVLRSN